jgi:hypothetical protein
MENKNILNVSKQAFTQQNNFTQVYIGHIRIKDRSKSGRLTEISKEVAVSALLHD